MCFENFGYLLIDKMKLTICFIIGQKVMLGKFTIS